MANKIISRAEAKANQAAAKKKGETEFDGKLCAKCHTNRRYTNNNKCIVCHKKRNELRPKKGKTGKTTKSKAVSKAITPAGALVPVNSEPLTGEVMNGDWRFYADRIITTWRASVENIIATGKLLIEAKAKFGHHGDWLRLTKKLPFGERTAQRLMEIARHPVLSNPTHVSHLPPSWGTIHALTRLPEPVLIAKIDDRTINPEMECGDVDVIVAEIEAEATEVTDAPKSEEEVTEAEWPKSSPDDDEVTEAEIIEEAPPSLAELVERWQNSLATMAGDTIALPANWDRVFGNWREFDKPSNLITLAEQAADTWAKIVEIMRRAASEAA